jgi:type IV pilus assembly protein PilV
MNFKPTRHRTIHRRSQQSGVGLIEVMVAILLLAMGLLGAVALQFATAKEQRSSQFVARAAMLSNEIAERMRSNRAAIEDITTPQYLTATKYADVKQVVSTSPSVGVACTQANPCLTAAATAANDINVWLQSVNAMMPQSAAMLLMPTEGINALSRTIVIAWVEPVVDKDKDGAPIVINQTSGNNGCPSSIDAAAGVRCYQLKFVL